jgi:hypothetical protein
MSTTFDDAAQQRGDGAQDAGAVKAKRRPPPPIERRSDADVDAIMRGEKRNSKGGRPDLYKLSPDWQAAQARKAAALAGGQAQYPSPNLDVLQGGDLTTTTAKTLPAVAPENHSQFLARQGLSLAAVLEHAPNAVDLLGKIVKGKLGGEKVPLGLRLQAAFKILDAGGINAQVGERIEAALKAPGGASLQSLAAKLIEASNLAKSRAETGQTSGKASEPEPIPPL